MPNLSNSITVVRGPLRAETTTSFPNGAFRSSSVSTIQNVAKVTTVNRQGVNTPGYHNPKRVGLLPVNPFTFDIREETRWVGSYTEFDPPERDANLGGNRTTYSGHIGGSPPDGAPLFTSGQQQAMRNRVNQRLLRKVKDQKVNLAVAYAERARTKQLVADSLLKLARAAGAARKGNLFEAARHLGVSPRAPRNQSSAKTASQNWLELQYGWKPLVSDIYGIAEAYNASRINEPIYEKAGARETLSGTVVEKPNNSESSAYTVNVLTNWEIEYKTGAFFKQTDPSSSTPKTLAELGITNPAAVAWEVLPWSFVVDWFLPIGNMLDTLDATLGVEFVQGFTLEVQKKTVYAQRDYKSSGRTIRTGTASAVLKVVTVSRGKLLNFPSVSFPEFKDPYSHEHFANALALLITNFRK